MKVRIHPFSVDGSVKAPPSKSYMQRAVAIASLAADRTVVKNPSLSDDGRVSMRIAEQLGCLVTVGKEEVQINSSRLQPSSVLNCGESGLSCRLFSVLAALSEEAIEVTGEGSLLNRNMEVLENSLRNAGISVASDNGFLPLSIKGPLQSGIIELDGSRTSQVLTGFLIVLPLLAGNSELLVYNLVSKPYIDITLEIMEEFGVTVSHRDYKIFSIKGGQQYKCPEYTVEGDWSGSSFHLVAAAVSGRVNLLGIDRSSLQADAKILDALRSAGSEVILNNNSVEVRNTGELSGFEFDATDCPDLFPPLAALCVNCKGQSRIKGVNRLYSKESNRYITLSEEFAKLGVSMEKEDDFLIINGQPVSGGEVDSRNDHRIAMALAVAAANADSEVLLNGAECINKSYPDFFKDFQSIGARMEIIESTMSSEDR